MDRRIDPPGLTAGVLGVGLLNTAVVNAFPFLAGTLMDREGMSSAGVGLLISMELLVSAVVALALSAPRLRLSPRVCGLAACAAFAVGNLLATQADGAMLVAARCLAGVGGGLGLAAAGRAIARASSPARLGATAALILAGLGGVIALITGWLVAHQGYSGGALFLAAITAIGAPLASFLPHAAPISRTPLRAPCDAIQWSAALPLAFATGLAFLASGAIWSYSERIGLAAGLSPDAVTLAIGLTALAGVGGGAIAMMVAKAGRNFLASGMGVAVFGTSATALALAGEPYGYVLALTSLSFAFIFLWPFLLASAVEIDPSGGLASAAYGAQMLAGAFAPFLGGLLLLSGSFRSLAMFAGFCTIAALACIAMSYRALRKRHSAFGVR